MQQVAIVLVKEVLVFSKSVAPQRDCGEKREKNTKQTAAAAINALFIFLSFLELLTQLITYICIQYNLPSMHKQ